MVIITIGVNRRLHSVTNFFITQLALGDLCVLIFCMPFTVTAAYFFKVRLISTFIIITPGTRMYLLTHSTFSIDLILQNGGRRMFSFVFGRTESLLFGDEDIFSKLKPIYLTYINECSTIVCFRAGYLVMVYASWSKQQAAWELRFQSVLCVS